jgi:adenosylcobinamide-GDP ribazoletransferase
VTTPAQAPPTAGWRAAPWRALGALGLLSVVPLPRRAHGLPGASTLAAFAPAGLLLGGLLAGLEVGLAPVLPVGARSAVLLAALIALSGAMHLDGLMDSADGLFGGRDRERRLEIMRDSRAGAYGVAAAIAVVLVQYSALVSLSGGQVQTLVAAVGLSRAVSAFALGIAPPARAEGLGSVFTVPRRGLGGTAALAIAAGLAVWLCGWRGLAATGVTVAAALGVIAVFRRRVRGMTGDGFGAIIELALAGALLCLAAR